MDRGFFITLQAVRRLLAAMPNDLYLLRLIHHQIRKPFPAETLWTGFPALLQCDDPIQEPLWHGNTKMVSIPFASGQSFSENSCVKSGHAWPRSSVNHLRMGPIFLSGCERLMPR